MTDTLRRSTRRQFIKETTLVSSALALGPYFVFGQAQPSTLMKRNMGRLGFEATTLGLGGQASLQWTPEDVDPTKIILKAFDLGVNYFDTANVYDLSQTHYGRAFRELHLIPDAPGYNERLRRSIFVSSKTFIRFGKGGMQKPGATTPPTTAVDELRRSLSQMFGDGSGSYPKGAYLDQIMLHSIMSMNDPDSLFNGYEKPDPKAETIGALAALIDFRDGTNLTGLNPKEEKLIRHIGFSGHATSDAMIEMIHRDTRGVFDSMLVAINANDRRYFSMQNNVIPVAAANNLGIIAMKVFSDGTMYGKQSSFTSRPDMIVRTIGSPAVPSRRLIEYALTIPGVHTAIIGIGHIDNDPAACQLRQNLSAAQIAPNGLSQTDRREIEKIAGAIKVTMPPPMKPKEGAPPPPKVENAPDGMTNYFQAAARPLSAPRNPELTSEERGGRRLVRMTWQTAYAGDEPIVRYEILRDGMKTGEIPHAPQAKATPFSFEDSISLSDSGGYRYRIVSVDAAGRTAQTEEIAL